MLPVSVLLGVFLVSFLLSFLFFAPCFFFVGFLVVLAPEIPFATCVSLSLSIFSELIVGQQVVVPSSLHDGLLETVSGEEASGGRHVQAPFFDLPLPAPPDFVSGSGYKYFL